MSEKYIGIPKELPGFSTQALKELRKTYEAMGYEYRQPQLGGGNAKIITQTVAWLNENSFFSSIFVAIATEISRKLFKEARIWYKSKRQNTKKSDKNVRNVININFSGCYKSFWIELDISKVYTKKQIKKIINKARRRGVK